MALVDLHLFTLGLTAVVILYSDYHGLSYFLGKKPVLSPAFVTWSHRLVWFGLLGMITTGALMLLPSWEYRLSDPAFYVKIGFVLMLIINGVAIGKLSKVASLQPFAHLTRDEQYTLILSGAISATCWIGSAMIGFLFL